MSKRKDTHARRDAYLLGMSLGLPQRMRRIKAMLPPEGILSGPAPTFYEMREYRDAKPALDPFMQVFRP